ncbi:MAG TPA: Sir2 family NAD-dependent protein deacetylase [Acidimicrobiales bacterium]|nr:Sir2 family NAD-dependent protein deacetylase [Acidimicrobiales bacterium]
MNAIEEGAALVDDAERICVLTGAGISTDSGIPDFRGPNGVWTKNPGAERAATIQNYLRDPHTRQRAWQRYLDGGVWIDREPNDGHRALVRLEEQGKLDTLITQNVDGLHARAGTSEDRLVEIHGTMAKAMCLSCNRRWPIVEVLERLRAGETDPHCLVCGGILKSATISFGQSLVAEDLERSELAATSCDLLIAVGTSLAVVPIAYVVPIAARHGAPVIILNAEPTPYDDIATVLVSAGISEALPRIVG